MTKERARRFGILIFGVSTRSDCAKCGSVLALLCAPQNPPVDDHSRTARAIALLPRAEIGGHPVGNSRRRQCPDALTLTKPVYKADYTIRTIETRESLFENRVGIENESILHL